LEQNEQAVRTWMQMTCPEVKKKVEDGATLVYLDEVGFSLKGVVRRTWALRGKTPVVRLPASLRKLSTIGAITSKGQFLQHTQSGSVKTPDVLRFLGHPLNHIPGDLVLVLDNAAIHRRRLFQPSWRLSRACRWSICRPTHQNSTRLRKSGLVSSAIS